MNKQKNNSHCMLMWFWSCDMLCWCLWGGGKMLGLGLKGNHPSTVVLKWWKSDRIHVLIIRDDWLIIINTNAPITSGRHRPTFGMDANATYRQILSYIYSPRKCFTTGTTHSGPASWSQLPTTELILHFSALPTLMCHGWRRRGTNFWGAGWVFY